LRDRKLHALILSNRALENLAYGRMVRAVIDCSTPIIGTVNGAAYGGGS